METPQNTTATKGDIQKLESRINDKLNQAINSMETMAHNIRLLNKEDEYLKQNIEQMSQVLETVQQSIDNLRAQVSKIMIVHNNTH